MCSFFCTRVVIHFEMREIRKWRETLLRPIVLSECYQSTLAGFKLTL